MSRAAKTGSVAETLQKALRLHQAGQLDKAARLYGTVLKKNPDNGDALNLKGVVAQAHGRHDDALALFGRAITALPDFADVHFNKANTLKALGRNDDALAAYAKAIALKPDYADARLNAGTLLQKTGRTTEAIAAFREMARFSPADPRGHYSLGVCLTEALPAAKSEEREAMTEEADAAFIRTVTLNPNNADAHFAHANLYSKQGNHDRAIQCNKAVINLKPNWPEAWSNLGELLRKDHRYEEAVAASRQAAALRADDLTIQYNLATVLCDAKEYGEAERLFLDLIKFDGTFMRAYLNLGMVYKRTNRRDEALNMFDKALFLNPDLHEAYSNIGAVFSDMGWSSAALSLYDKAISLNTDTADPTTLLYRGAIVLSLGRLAEGWSQYKYRFDAPNEQIFLRDIPPAYWDGEDLTGQSVLIWTEQGLGDEILHGSILPDVIRQAGQCVIECSKRMVPVFARSFPAIRVVGYKASNIPATSAEGIDYQIPLASLGQHFRSDFASFPRHDGYLKADPDKAAELRARYEALAGGRRIVGISWRSNNEFSGEAKSTALTDMAPLLQASGVMFVNLQYGDCTDELMQVREQLNVEVIQDPAVDPLVDMDMFFAQVAALDLVLSTSNTTAHVAGSQNIPVWVLLPHGKGVAWYWFLRRADSPWYPSARLIRADHRLEPGQARWLELAERTATELTSWAAPSPVGG